MKHVILSFLIVLSITLSIFGQKKAYIPPPSKPVHNERLVFKTGDAFYNVSKTIMNDGRLYFQQVALGEENTSLKPNSAFNSDTINCIFQRATPYTDTYYHYHYSKDTLKSLFLEDIKFSFLSETFHKHFAEEAFKADILYVFETYDQESKFGYLLMSFKQIYDHYKMCLNFGRFTESGDFKARSMHCYRLPERKMKGILKILPKVEAAEVEYCMANNEVNLLTFNGQSYVLSSDCIIGIGTKHKYSTSRLLYHFVLLYVLTDYL